jgi:hypothetical protein
MLPVPDSSRLTHIGFQPPEQDALTGALWVRFTDGTTGYYDGVPLDTFAQMKLSSSKGQFLSQQVIRAAYPFTKAPLPDQTNS